MFRLADQHVDTIMPGYTHLQRAHLVRTSYYDLLLDVRKRQGRFMDSLKRIDICPLGAAALSGTTL